MNDEYPCTSCGLCCKNLDKMFSTEHSPIIQFLIDKFPYKTLEDGSCEMLDGNICTVYDDRPLICNVKLGGQILGLDRDEWYQYLAKHCNNMIDEAGLTDDYHVSL